MISIVEGEISSFISAATSEMQKPIIHFEKEITSIRTGKASRDLVEGIRVEAYGQSMSLREVASINIPDPKMIVLQPWDKGLLDALQAGIRNSDLGINPVVDGDVVRLNFPMMSTERRDELVKVLSKKTEEAKVGIRNVRRDFKDLVKSAEKKKEISEDFAKKLNEELQKATDSQISCVDVLAEKKESALKTL